MHTMTDSRFKMPHEAGRSKSHIHARQAEVINQKAYRKPIASPVRTSDNLDMFDY